MSTDTLVLIGVVGLGLGLLAIWLVVSRRGAARTADTRTAEAESAPVSDDLPSAPASEAIEDLVKKRLARIPGLANTRVDFATAPDGSLSIWIGSDRYASVDEIRDPRIREAVREAVAAFNR
jgi:hypothetical protein